MLVRMNRSVVGSLMSPEMLDRLRRSPSAQSVPGTPPVLMFGRIESATVATVGLNPSHREYLDQSGVQLSRERRRLETLETVGAHSRGDLTDAQCRAILDSQSNYHARNQYAWFRPLDRVLSALGGGFNDGTAVHLDLVQEATKPTWSSLARHEREALLAVEGTFLRWQLTSFEIDTVICSSATVGLNVRSLVGGEIHDSGDINGVTWWTGCSDSSPAPMWLAGWNKTLARAGLTIEQQGDLGRAIAKSLKTAGR